MEGEILCVWGGGGWEREEERRGYTVNVLPWNHTYSYLEILLYLRAPLDLHREPSLLQ